jgi:hypothetical protein
MKTAITSMTPEYYAEKGGKKCIETFLQNWPERIKLAIYWEGNKRRPGIDSRVQWLPMHQVEHLAGFHKAISYFPLMSGSLGNGYNIEYDARMCRAGFIHAHAMKTIGGKVFWIDADMVTHSPVPESFLDEILPDDKLACCLMRECFNTETGFLGMNAGHPAANSWIDIWQKVYTTGLIFTQQGWHDNWGFDLARSIFKRPELFNDLAKDLPYGTMHPLISSSLGAYFDHLKGQRKNGKSHKSDLVVTRTEPYWND